MVFSIILIIVIREVKKNSGRVSTFHCRECIHAHLPASAQVLCKAVHYGIALHQATADVYGLDALGLAGIVHPDRLAGADCRPGVPQE